jgi:hypothetical protein
MIPINNQNYIILKELGRGSHGIVYLVNNNIFVSFLIKDLM